MATLQELMAECFGEPSAVLQKQASESKASVDEIDEVLANLGLEDSETVEAASETEKTNENGGTMGLQHIYEQIMEEQVGQEKVAGETTEPVEQVSAEEATPTTAFGELVGEYFNVMAVPFFEKVAGDLEDEAGEGSEPLSGLGDAKEQMPHLPVNADMKNGRSMQATTGGASPYSLRDKALIKQILARAAARQSGNVAE